MTKQQKNKIEDNLKSIMALANDTQDIIFDLKESDNKNSQYHDLLKTVFDLMFDTSTKIDNILND